LVVCPFAHGESIENTRDIKVTSSFAGKELYHKFITGKNHALIIGIDEYKNHDNLKTAVNDAKTVSQLLKEKYFFSRDRIILLTNENATKTKIVQALRDMVELKVSKDDNVFIYYAGHGWYDKTFQTGYWVTHEATKDPTSFLGNSAVYQSIDALNRKHARHILLVSDSCFSGSFTREHRTIETQIDDRYFQEKYKNPLRNILTSGGLEPVIDAGKDGHSVFALLFYQNTSGK